MDTLSSLEDGHKFFLCRFEPLSKTLLSVFLNIPDASYDDVVARLIALQDHRFHSLDTSELGALVERICWFNRL